MLSFAAAFGEACFAGPPRAVHLAVQVTGVNGRQSFKFLDSQVFGPAPWVDTGLGQESV